VHGVVLMTLKTASLVGLRIAQKSFDGIDYWLERCQSDMTGEEGRRTSRRTSRRRSASSDVQGDHRLRLSAGVRAQQTSMTAVGMVSRSFSVGAAATRS
jgi:hypothetical protein